MTSIETSYFLNFMGPVNSAFLKEYGYHWAGGRIDVTVYSPGQPYPSEYEFGLPLMYIEDWLCLGGYLKKLSGEGNPMSYEEIISEYEKHRGEKIRWFSSAN